MPDTVGSKKTSIRRWLQKAGLFVTDDSLALLSGDVGGGGGGAESLTGDVTGSLVGTAIATAIGAGKVTAAMAAADLLALISAAASPVLAVTKTITNAQVLAFNTTPILAIPAVVGVTHVVTCVRVLSRQTSAWTANNSLRLRYTGKTDDIITPIFNTFSGGNARLWTPTVVTGSFIADLADCEGLGVSLSASGDNTGGNAANRYIVWIEYVEITVPA